MGASQPYVDALGLVVEDEGAEEAPERSGHLLEVIDSGAGDLRVEEERGALHLLAHEEAERRKHGDAAVGDLDVGVTLSLGLVDAVEETEGVDASLEGSDALFVFARRGAGESGVRRGGERR